MRRIRSILALSATALLLGSCLFEPPPHFGWMHTGELPQGGFAIHLLADSSMSGIAAAEQSLESLALASTPLISEADLESYDLCTHTLQLNEQAAARVADLLPEAGHIGVQGLPFVVSAGSERIYLGAFWSLVSSYAFSEPIVMVEDLAEDGFYLMHIESAYPSGEPASDPRSDARIIAVLGQAGKLVDSCTGY